MSAQLIPVNVGPAKRFTPQQKLQIIKEWELSGNGVAVAEKHQIHPMTLYRWKRALQRGAETFLSGKQLKTDPQLRRLQQENQQLFDFSPSAEVFCFGNKHIPSLLPPDID
jgi:transposase-like protein